ncbi:MAG: hypothetical protein J6K13_11400 [Clostridia bacterium]|nr:hypothetical protein [Clostridia bacterium]
MKRGMRILAFLLVFMVAYTWIDGILHTKTTDGIGTMKKYYELPKDTVDVLMVGSSHMGMNVNPTQMWDEHGIAAYNLWSGMQPIWNSYYFVKEGLKYQNPKLVVVDVFLCSVLNEYSDSSAALKSVQAMKMSLDKLGAAVASFPTWQQAAEAIWGMPTYHTRFDELAKDDFTFDEFAQELDLVQINANSTLTQEQPPYPIRLKDYASIKDSLPLSEKSEKYLRKLIDLCSSKDVPLLLIAAPFEATEDEFRRLNRVGEIAAEKGVAYLNCLADLDAYDVDPKTDFWDVGHLNASGIPKFTRKLSHYLLAQYDLPDRRLEEDHIWANGVINAADDSSVWKMDQQFTGDGVSRYIDTGVKLYENRYGSWTLLTSLDMTQHPGEEVYMSCFCETPGEGNYGLLIRRKTDDRLAVKLGNNIDVDIMIDSDVINLAIVKNVEKYTVYANGKMIVKDYELPCPKSYAGTLLIGCQELAPGGEKFRHSCTTVMDLKVYQNVQGESRILGWTPAQLPAMAAPLGMDGQVKDIYVLPEQFVGDSGSFVQNAYIDTGLKLYEESAASFTILSRITPSVVDGDKVFFSTFSEVPGEYRGLLVRQLEDQLLNVIVGNNHGITLPCVPGQMMDLAIVKTLNQYAVYVDGKLVQQIDSACAPYAGTLLIGAQRDGDGNIFRQSSTCVNSFAVKSGVMDESEIQKWNFTDAPMPQVRVATSVNYALASRFLGNGQDRYIDTGVQLYDIPQKDWTMAVTLNFEYGKNSGVYLSCFSEEVGNYRGFMIRQEAEDSITILVGNALSYKIQLSEMDRTVRLVVTKRGNQYAIYRNGSLETSLESSCDSYEGTLLIGCQETTEGEKFRFSTAKVDELTMTDGALTDEQAAELSTVQEGVSRF